MPMAKILFLPKTNTKAYLELPRQVDKYNFQVLWKVNYIKSNFKKIQPSKGSRLQPLPLVKKMLLLTADTKDTGNCTEFSIVNTELFLCQQQNVVHRIVKENVGWHRVPQEHTAAQASHI